MCTRRSCSTLLKARLLSNASRGAPTDGGRNHKDTPRSRNAGRNRRKRHRDNDDVRRFRSQSPPAAPPTPSRRRSVSYKETSASQGGAYIGKNPGRKPNDACLMIKPKSLATL